MTLTDGGLLAPCWTGAERLFDFFSLLLEQILHRHQLTHTKKKKIYIRTTDSAPSNMFSYESSNLFFIYGNYLERFNEFISAVDEGKDGCSLRYFCG